jgi:hypothetical protein
VAAVAPDGLAHEHALQAPTGSVTYAGWPEDLGHEQTAASPTGIVTYVATPDGAVHDHVLGDGWGVELLTLYLSVPQAGARQLSWQASGTVYLVVDGELEAESVIGYADLDADRRVRGVLIAVRRLPDPLPTPRDEVLLTITGDPVLHHIERRPDGGSWERIASILGDTYRDGPLGDGLYHYRAVAEDDEGDRATSDTESVTVSSMPDPPSGFAATWDAPAQTVTFTWQASPSADLAGYRIREGQEQVDLGSEPVYEGAALTWQRTFTDETGVSVWSLRAVDLDGNEEQNVSQVVALPFEDGALAARPAEPRLVEAYAADGGRIELEWLYDPRYEEYGPGAAPGAQGAAAEARIYWDAGSGTVDFSAPHATVPMGQPTSAARFTWLSVPLTGGQEYRFVVRIATAAWPSGFQTQSVGEHAAAADADTPSTPELVGQVV